jgi:multicomponent K+:H+ antiporter subunit D
LNHLPILPVVLPALAAALMLIDRRIAVQQGLALLAALLTSAAAALLLVFTASDWSSVYLLGNWAAPWGIVLLADRLSALMVALCSLLGLGAVILARTGIPSESNPQHLHPLLQIQIAGVNGAFLTADLFNLFVFFEVLLIASYGLLVHGDGRARILAGLRYVTLNLVGSALFLIAAGLIYGLTGTLNLADLSGRLAALDGLAAQLGQAALGVLLTVFMLKAGLMPLGLWMSRTYPVTCLPVAWLFVILTKVGLICMLRVLTLAASESAWVMTGLWLNLLAVLGVLTLLIAALGMLRAASVVQIATLVVAGSAGFLAVGIGYGHEQTVAAALAYMPHGCLAAAALIVVAHRIDQGHRGALEAIAFFALASAVAGLPPWSGFLAKAMLLVGTLSADAQTPSQILRTVVWVGVLTASGLSLIALMRAGGRIFWSMQPIQAATAVAEPHRGSFTADGIVKDRVAQDRVAQDRVVHNGVVHDGVVHDGVVHDRVAQDRVAQDRGEQDRGAQRLVVGSLLALFALTLAASPVQTFALNTARDLANPSAVIERMLRTSQRPSPQTQLPDPVR